MQTRAAQEAFYRTLMASATAVDGVQLEELTERFQTYHGIPPARVERWLRTLGSEVTVQNGRIHVRRGANIERYIPRFRTQNSRPVR